MGTNARTGHAKCYQVDQWELPCPRHPGRDPLGKKKRRKLQPSQHILFPLFLLFFSCLFACLMLVVILSTPTHPLITYQPSFTIPFSTLSSNIAALSSPAVALFALLCVTSHFAVGMYMYPVGCQPPLPNLRSTDTGHLLPPPLIYYTGHALFPHPLPMILIRSVPPPPFLVASHSATL